MSEVLGALRALKSRSRFGVVPSADEASNNTEAPETAPAVASAARPAEVDAPRQDAVAPPVEAVQPEPPPSAAPTPTPESRVGNERDSEPLEMQSPAPSPRSGAGHRRSLGERRRVMDIVRSERRSDRVHQWSVRLTAEEFEEVREIQVRDRLLAHELMGRLLEVYREMRKPKKSRE